MHMISEFLYGSCLLGAYLLGSLSSAVIVCRLLKLPDPREVGSGNPGATNVARIAGKKIAALVLVCDALKGFLPVIIVYNIFGLAWLSAWVAFAAFLGHLYPVFFRFKGGKGVATTLGGLFGLHWILGVTFAGTWLVIAALFKRSSLAALVAAAVTPFLALFLLGPIATLPIILMILILFWRHRENIQRLINKTEPTI